jgi:tol-pal system protein YbgF
MNRFWISLLAALSAVHAGCTIPQQVEHIEMEQRRLRQESALARSESAQSQRDADAVRSLLADMRANTQEMQTEVSALRGKMDELRYLIEQSKDRSAREGDLKAKDLEDRVRGLEGRLARVDEDLQAQLKLVRSREEELGALRQSVEKVAREQKDKAALPVRPEERKPKPLAPAQADDARREYEGAWKFLEARDYQTALVRFQEFLKRNPDSEYADNAQYWIGECYYGLRQFDQAILEFDAVRRKYPQGDKVPAALLKQAYAFAELGDKVDARLILQELIVRYPQSEEATKAKQKLKALES